MKPLIETFVGYRSYSLKEAWATANVIYRIRKLANATRIWGMSRTNF
ncbi:MAG TPA: hypothetical protein VLG47_07110 [Candidatus Saccharimonadales bacterium]|nr:hypothetical protein [Candidatus Saccharimonadales bacterium]